MFVSTNNSCSRKSYVMRITAPEIRDRREVEEGKARVAPTLKEMSDRHHEVARLLVLGMSQKKVAEITGMTPTAISGIRTSPQVREKMAALQALRDGATVNIAKRIGEMLPKCLDYLEGTIDNEEVSHAIKSQNARHMLAVGGHSPLKNVRVAGFHAILGPEDLKEIRERAAAAGSAILSE